MKRIIVLALCMAMLLSASVTAVAQETVFNSNTDTSTALFLISGSNKAGQEFVAGFTSLQGIKVYLNNEVAGNAVTVAVYQGSAAAEDCVLLYTEELSLTGTGYAWYELTFSQAVTVEADALCSFTLNAKDMPSMSPRLTAEYRLAASLLFSTSSLARMNSPVSSMLNVIVELPLLFLDLARGTSTVM